MTYQRLSGWSSFAAIGLLLLLPPLRAKDQVVSPFGAIGMFLVALMFTAVLLSAISSRAAWKVNAWQQGFLLATASFAYAISLPGIASPPLDFPTLGLSLNASFIVLLFALFTTGMLSTVPHEQATSG